MGSNDITATTGTAARHIIMSKAGNTSVVLHTAVISGGPLIDEKGNVVGLNAYGIADSYACAIYIDYVMQALDELGIPYMTAGSTIPVVTVAAAAVAVAAVAVIVFFILRNRKGTAGSKSPVGGIGATIPVSASFRLQMPDVKIIPVPAGKVMVGREPSCQILFPEDATAVSCRHCTLENGGEFLVLMDG